MRGAGRLVLRRLRCCSSSRGLPAYSRALHDIAASQAPFPWRHSLRSARSDSCSDLLLPHRFKRRGFLGFGDGDEESGMSKHHEEKRVMGYSPEQLFDIVAGVDMYQDFVPWCQKSSVIRRQGDVLEAELEIGFQFFVESYVSHVQLKRPSLVKTTVSNSTIFEHLTNVWEISPGPQPGSCSLHFLVDFKFRSPLYSKVANMFFDEVVARLVTAFENRCLVIYGPAKVILAYHA